MSLTAHELRPFGAYFGAREIQNGVVAALVFDARESAIAHWRALLDSGIYTNLMVPPATPSGLSIVRISLSAAHTDEDIDRILATHEALARPASVRATA